jgi:death-on-curing protein
MAIKFISEDLVPIIHRSLIQRYGGSYGIRDHALLSSALAQAKMTAGGKFAHRTIFDKAAAYGFHICANHPFVDGNKRAAFAVMYLFLARNGYSLEASEQDAYQTMMNVAVGQMKKPQLAAWLRVVCKRSDQ